MDFSLLLIRKVEDAVKAAAEGIQTPGDLITSGLLPGGENQWTVSNMIRSAVQTLHSSITINLSEATRLPFLRSALCRHVLWREFCQSEHVNSYLSRSA